MRHFDQLGRFLGDFRSLLGRHKSWWVLPSLAALLLLLLLFLTGETVLPNIFTMF